MISQQMRAYVQRLASERGLAPEQIGVHGSFSGRPAEFKKNGITASPRTPSLTPGQPTTFTAPGTYPEVAEAYAAQRPGLAAAAHSISGGRSSQPEARGRGEHRGSLVFVDLTHPGIPPTQRLTPSGAPENWHAGNIPPEAIIHVQSHGVRVGQDKTHTPDLQSRLRAFRHAKTVDPDKPPTADVRY